MNSYIVRWGALGSLLAFASIGYAQYTMELTGVGDGATSGNVYVSPYQGSIWAGAYTGGAPSGSPLYSGYVICDDFSDEASLYQYWNADSTNAGSLSGSELFTSGYVDPNSGVGWSANHPFTAQQAYDAVAWLANQLLMPTNLTNSTSQTNISFAIWDIMDGQSTDPDGGAAGWIAQAFNQVVNDNYVGTDVTVFTPAPTKSPGQNPSQEFLVVDAPSVPEASTPVLLGADLLGFMALVGFLRKRVLRNN